MRPRCKSGVSRMFAASYTAVICKAEFPNADVRVGVTDEPAEQ